jgi:2-polyprenyl-6-methoxyphenol hydroxylase-like FAD-dependent oxidoreductase
LRSATREAPFAGAGVPNYFRKPYGPGWALVGDAGYNKDFITAQGILDSFRDAELCATAIDQSLSGARPFEEAMGEYQRIRDADVGAMYDFTCDLATLEPPPPELQRILGAVHGNQAAMDGFARVNAGTISPTEFFAPENVEAIFAAAAERTQRMNA